MLVALSAVVSYGQEGKVAPAGTETSNILHCVDATLTNAIPNWVRQLQDKDKKKREQAASYLFSSAMLASQFGKDKTVGDQIVAAYRKESLGEIKLALLATLDVMEHPSVQSLLEEAGKDPSLRKLIKIIKEKRYLQPVEVEDP